MYKINPFAWVPVAMVIWVLTGRLVYLAAVAWIHLGERGEEEGEE